MSKVDGELKASQWWLTNETSGRCEVYLASLAIKQSTLVRHAFEVPLYRFVLQWHPLPSHAQVIEFKVMEWDELDPKTLENRGESQNLAGFFSWTINAATGALLTVLSGPLSETRIKKFCSACQEVHMKLSRQEMLALFIDYAQEAAQQVANDLWRLMIGPWCPQGREDCHVESEEEITLDEKDGGGKEIRRELKRQSVDPKTFKESFVRVAQGISWAFEDMEPERAIEEYSGRMERSPGDPLRGSVNAFSELLTPDQFDEYTLREEFNRALTMFCLKQHATKFRKRRWEAMRCTSQVYLLEDKAIRFEGVSDTRKYKTRSFLDGRPKLVHMEREQESAATLEARSLFAYRLHHTRALFVWGGEDEGDYASKDAIKDGVRDFHNNFAKKRGAVEARFANLYSISPALQIKLQKAFTFLDITRDGTLDSDELKAMLCKAKERDVSDEEVTQAMLNFDPSGNGVIEPSEFLQYMITKGSSQDSILPIARIESICRAGWKCDRIKASASTSSSSSSSGPSTSGAKPIYIEICPFTSELLVYERSAAETWYDEKAKKSHLKKVIDLHTRTLVLPEEEVDDKKTKKKKKDDNEDEKDGDKKKHSKKNDGDDEKDDDKKKHAHKDDHKKDGHKKDDHKKDDEKKTEKKKDDHDDDDDDDKKKGDHEKKKDGDDKKKGDHEKKKDDDEKDGHKNEKRKVRKTKDGRRPTMLKFVKTSNSHSSITLVFTPEDYENITSLLERFLDNDANQSEARPVVQELLVEAALPTLVILPDY